MTGRPFTDTRVIHLVPGPVPQPTQPPAKENSSRDWELYAYRDRTAALLRRYLRLSLLLGRLPSILGGEMFRGRVTSYRIVSFEDLVIFVHDMDKCLARLSECSRNVIARMVFQEYTEREVAAMKACTARTVRRWYGEALDETSELLLRLRLVEPFNSVGERLAHEGMPRMRASSELPPRKPADSARSGKGALLCLWGR